jgi:hypothetical protein
VATGAIGAALIELQPKGSWLGGLVRSAAPSIGFAVDPFGTSALVLAG